MSFMLSGYEFILNTHTHIKAVSRGFLQNNGGDFTYQDGKYLL